MKMNGYYYRQKDGGNDMLICQYMRLDYLIQLLKTQKYYVNRRHQFIDANEVNNRIKFEFNLKPSINNTIPSTKKVERFFSTNDIELLPTACWTKRKQESFLMWKSYATEMGACIKTTKHNVIASIKTDISEQSENQVLCGSMDYKSLKPSLDEEKQLFDKDKAYAEEKEFRFYFHFPSYDTNKYANAITIPVDTKIMIDEIILSPFICKDAASEISQMITDKYNIQVKQSEIKLNL